MEHSMRTLRASLKAIMVVVLSGTLAPARTAAQAPPPIVGRWDLTVKDLGFPACSWLEVQPSGDRTLVGRFVGWGGSARPVSRVELADQVVRFAIPPQWEQGDGDLRVEGSVSGDEVSGTILDPAGRRLAWTGKRAPTLRRTTTPQWASPITLFDGTDLSRWQVPENNQWHVAGGILNNATGGGNLVTRDTFGDFKLHIEFQYPKDGNSGVYLRGRYEVQIEDSPPGRVRDESLGAVYGFLAPGEDAARGPDQWQTYDITLLGRRLTVALNGTTIINGQDIPGITGGAVTCDEAAPGPLMLQGDHGPIQYRNIVLIPAK
jgi:hypothetical protein